MHHILFDIIWRFDILDNNMMSYNNLIFDISASVVSIVGFWYRVLAEIIMRNLANSENIFHTGFSIIG